MLTVAYCRVSTEEQAREGFSIEGQADKLRTYALLHDLGDVTVLTDPGRSGKDLDRPGLQQLLGMIGDGHVAAVLVWRLDRLSRNVQDLARLADTFVGSDVALHSVNEKVDLTTATGKMFYNILGSFAQFYREQLGENVKLGLQQAVKEGKWPNRPKTGYRRVDGRLEPDEHAPLVRRMFHLRADGLSYRAIERETGISYSTVKGILDSRIYLGQTLYRGEWFPGEHEPILTEQEWQAAQRAHVPGRRRSRQLLAGRVRCGQCGRLAAVEYTTDGQARFRCRHRGQGCPYPRRRASALEQAMLLGLRLIGRNAELQQAIRDQADAAAARSARRGQPDRSDASIAELERKRHRLLDLYYADRITPDLFHEEEQRIAVLLDTARAEALEEVRDAQRAADVNERFEEIVAVLADLDLDAIWSEATEREKRVLVEEMVEEVAMYHDHLVVTVTGAPPLNVTLEEVGLGDRAERGCERGDSNPHRV